MVIINRIQSLWCNTSALEGIFPGISEIGLASFPLLGLHTEAERRSFLGAGLLFHLHSFDETSDKPVEPITPDLAKTALDFLGRMDDDPIKGAQVADMIPPHMARQHGYYAATQAACAGYELYPENITNTFFALRNAWRMLERGAPEESTKWLGWIAQIFSEQAHAIREFWDEDEIGMAGLAFLAAHRYAACTHASSFQSTLQSGALIHIATEMTKESLKSARLTKGLIGSASVDELRSTGYLSKLEGQHYKKSADDVEECATYFNNRVRLTMGNILGYPVDAIVNPANSSLLGGGGLDGQIHRAAGPEMTCEALTLRGCDVGHAKVTKGHGLRCRYIIHAVSPAWFDYTPGRVEALLRQTYRSILHEAEALKAKMIAIPAIGTGIFKIPITFAARVLHEELSTYYKGGNALIIFLPFSELTKLQQTIKVFNSLQSQATFNEGV